jgi:hypothetical protein
MPLMLLNQLQQLLNIFRLYARVRVVDQLNCAKYQAHADGFIQPPPLTGVNNYGLAHGKTPR